ncbi:MAG: DUF4959 domain-containing protein [Spirochaetia bacterium]|nr:DUF4959 domain-containing protein [Spirochaetia bacterium]
MTNIHQFMTDKNSFSRLVKFSGILSLIFTFAMVTDCKKEEDDTALLLGALAAASAPAPAVPDTTAPAEVTGATLETTHGGSYDKVTWTDPTDADFDHVEVTFTDGGGTKRTVTVAKGIEFYDANTIATGTIFKVGTTVTIKTVDKTGNKSTGVSLNVTEIM